MEIKYFLYNSPEECKEITAKEAENIMARNDVFTDLGYDDGGRYGALKVQGVTKEAAIYFGRGNFYGDDWFKVFKSYDWSEGEYFSIRLTKEEIAEHDLTNDSNESFIEQNPIFLSLWKEYGEYEFGEWEMSESKIIALIPWNWDACHYASTGGISKRDRAHPSLEDQKNELEESIGADIECATDYLRIYKNSISDSCIELEWIDRNLKDLSEKFEAYRLLFGETLRKTQGWR